MSCWVRMAWRERFDLFDKSVIQGENHVPEELSIAFGVCAGVCLVAQAVPAPPPLATIVDDKKLADETQTVVMAGGGFAGGGPALGAVRFMTTEFGMEGKTVKGAPYSAQAVTETTQTLADGNHIVHKSTALLARDSEGRTRREQTLDAVGPWATGEAPPTMVFIHDPVAQVSYSLDSHSKTASKMDIISDAREMKMRAERKMMQATQSGAVVRSSEKAPAEDIVAESLGSKTIEGVVGRRKDALRELFRLDKWAMRNRWFM